MYAALNNNLQVFEEILKHKFNIGLTDNLGKHLFEYCCDDRARGMIVSYILTYSDYIVKDR